MRELRRPNAMSQVGRKNKTIYIPQKDLEVWDQANVIAQTHGTGISTVIIEFLRSFVRNSKICRCGKPMHPVWVACPYCGSKVEEP